MGWNQSGSKFYLTRSQSKAWSLDNPVGDPYGGAAYGEKNDPVTAGVVGGGALLGSGLLGGGNKQTGSSTTTTSPWAPIQPYLLDVAKQGQDLYNRGPFNYQNVSPFTSQAENLIAQKALTPGSLTAQAQTNLGDTISGRYMSPDSNPYFKSGLDEALGQAKSAFAGQYGGFAGNNLNNSGYQEALAKNLGTIASNAYSNLYNTERQNQLNALQLAPSLDYANLGALQQVGATQDQRALQNYYSPFDALARYQQALSGGLGFGSTTSPIFSNPAAGALGGALGAAGLGRLTGLFGGGAAAGGAAGAGDLLGTMTMFA